MRIRASPLSLEPQNAKRSLTAAVSRSRALSQECSTRCSGVHLPLAINQQLGDCSLATLSSRCRQCQCPFPTRDWRLNRSRKGSAKELQPSSDLCEGVGDVVGVEAPLGGVAQVIFHGVQVVEVGVQVRVHQDTGEEEDGEGQVEVEREVEEIRENNTCATCG